MDLNHRPLGYGPSELPLFNPAMTGRRGLAARPNYEPRYNDVKVSRSGRALSNPILSHDGGTLRGPPRVPRDRFGTALSGNRFVTYSALNRRFTRGIIKPMLRL